VRRECSVAGSSRREDKSGSLVALLQSIAQDPAPCTEAGRLLEGLEGSLRSLENSH